MPITLAPAFKSAIEKVHGTLADDGLLWLVELQLARSYRSGATIVPSLVARMHSGSSDIIWPDSAPVFQQWMPANFSFTPIEQDTDGNLPQLDLSIDNTSRVLMRYMHGGEGMEGNYCRVHLVPVSTLSVAWPGHVAQTWNLQVAAAFANEEAITFRLERANFFTRTVPQDRYSAERCRWAFGSSECGYVLNAAAAYTTCPKTLDACVLRGLDHASRGLPVYHPGRFGGFPGIPTQR